MLKQERMYINLNCPCNPVYSNNNNLTIIRELNKVKVEPSQPTKHA